MPTRNRFRTKLSTGLWIILAGATTSFESSGAGEGIDPKPRQWTAQAVIRFSGTSTLHNFSGQLPSQPFALILSNGTWSASADVPAGQMSTASERRDRNMHQMLATNDFPLIRGFVTEAPVPPLTGTNITLHLKIRDCLRDLPVRVSDWKESAQEIRFHASWELSLKQYGLKPPSFVGVIRVGDRVELSAEVTARKPDPSTSSPVTVFP